MGKDGRMGELYGNLRIDNGIRRIGVNDYGDYIELSINDNTLTERFVDLLTWLDEEQKNMEAKGKELAEKHGDGPIIDKDDGGNTVINTSALSDVVKAEADLYRRCCEKIDRVFGEDTCKKVFGDVLPDDVLIWDFFEQITPILEKMSAERGEKISLRYDRKKKKNRQRSKEQLLRDYKEGK